MIELRLTQIPPEEKARMARTWEQNSTLMKSGKNVAEAFSNLFDYAVGVFRSGGGASEWDKVCTFAYLWSEYLIRTLGWEWMHCSVNGSDPVLAILAKDKRYLIIVDVLCLKAAQGEAPQGILQTLQQQIVKGQPLQEIEGAVMKMNTGP